MPSTEPAFSARTFGVATHPARPTSPGVAAHTAQCVCVMRRSGARRSTSPLSTWYRGSPALSLRLTSASIAPLGRSMSKAGRVHAGSDRTQGGLSHSWERPTRVSPAPSAATISVPLARSDRTRTDGLSRELLRDGRRVSVRELPLVPVRVGGRDGARRVEPHDLFGRKAPPDGPEVLPELLLVPGADDDVRDGRPLEEPVDRDLRHGSAGFLR